MKFVLFMLSLVSSALLLGCSSFGAKGSKEWSGRMTPPREHLEATKYQYQSMDRFYNEDGLTREHTEAVDFVVLTRFVEYAADKDQWQGVMLTSQKEGPVALTDLGFPEKNERIEYVWDSRGRVYKAGNRDPQSLFFIPAFPYPQKAMSIGQSWNYEHDWITKKGLAMKLKVSASLKEKGSCYKSKESCWLVDLKGEVVPPDELAQKNFKSTFIGQCWIDEKTGLVVQSWTASKEGLADNKNRIEVNSCLSSQSRDGDYPPCPSDTPK